MNFSIAEKTKLFNLLAITFEMIWYKEFLSEINLNSSKDDGLSFSGINAMKV